MDLTVETFRALARSSPWRWDSVHLVRHRGGPPSEGGVEAWVRRPGVMRVVADGEVHVVRETPTLVEVRRAPARSLETATLVEVRRAPARSLETPMPARDAHGLVAARPADVHLDDPMWQSYDWVAMLDPVELADGEAYDPVTGAELEQPSVGVELEDLRSGQRRGRETWWARAVPTQAYEPRCSCCPLLWCEVSDRTEYGTDEEPFVPTADYPNAYEVALDVQTGICVSVRAVDGTPLGEDHDVSILEVDADYPDEFFAERRWWRRR